MNAKTNLDGAAPAVKAAPEVRLKGSAVSRGVAIGKIVCLHGTNRQFYRIDIKPSEIEAEIKRLGVAVTLAKRQLTRIASRKAGRIADSGPGIFEAHRMLIEDSSLQTKFEKEITEQNVNAEWAIKHVTDTYVAKYKAIDDEHLRDRYIDIEDVAERILAALGGSSAPKFALGKNAIIAAKELRPSTLIELAEDAPTAIITENGGWTSHSFIIAREMGCPAVTGLKKIFRRIKTGDMVIVDGFNGQVILNPSKETIDRFSAAADADSAKPGSSAKPHGPLKTLDGTTVRIYANSDSPAAYRKAKALGANGIGLYRSEFLFDRFRGVPTEAEQYKAYCLIADSAGEGGVKIRTFDLGAERLLDQNASKEKNPALGLRAVRLGLRFKQLLRTQIRALLRASANRHIDIVIPMVSGLSEIRSVKEMVHHEAELLASKGKSFGSPRLGAMIEIPSAVFMINELVEETDFICLGTNDLIQYLLAVDRDNEAVADWYRSLHPSVLKAVRTVLETANRAGKSAIVCGEMAGSPYYVPMLIGLGATELSMNVHSIEKVARMVAGIAADEAGQLIDSIGSVSTVEEVEETLNQAVKKNWAHLFPPNFSFA